MSASVIEQKKAVFIEKLRRELGEDIGKLLADPNFCRGGEELSNG